MIPFLQFGNAYRVDTLLFPLPFSVDESQKFVMCVWITPDMKRMIIWVRPQKPPLITFHRAISLQHKKM